MANGRFQFCSDCLRRMVEFHMVLPNDLPKEWTAEIGRASCRERV